MLVITNDDQQNEMVFDLYTNGASYISAGLAAAYISISLLF